ncbi:MAG: MarC family protein [Proteobacteria bacterium]|nr:MarC family protein [Pseudomonadota bacterium]
MMESFWLCFVPLFVAVDPPGILPLFLGFTSELSPARIRRLIVTSVITASAVAFGFLALGTAILRLMNITVADFMVAGGLVLLVLSITDLVNPGKERRFVDPDSLGAVPLGVPLITGPAVLTTTVLLLGEHGLAPTALAIAANMALTALTFFLSGPIIRVLGKTGVQVISKIAALFLAAIAVMMIRRGLTQWGL